MPSKVPSRFGIDLHVDDDITVKQNGARYGFRVLIVDRFDTNWMDRVIFEAERTINKRSGVSKSPPMHL